MTRVHKTVNLIGVPLPLIGLLVAIVLLWNRAVGLLEVGLLVGFYVVTCLGVTLGYHRMFTHRAFESSRAFRAIIAVLGSMAVEGSVITWVADHRMVDQLGLSLLRAQALRRRGRVAQCGVGLAPLSMGESWHHNHHAFPTSAFRGLRSWERIADPTGLLIALLEKLGIVWNVVRISPERQQAKTVPPERQDRAKVVPET